MSHEQYRDGDLGRQELARQRAEALRNGTVREFDEQHAKVSGDAPENASTPEERARTTKEGKPWSARLSEASRFKFCTGDPRNIDEIAKLLHEGADENYLKAMRPKAAAN